MVFGLNDNENEKCQKIVSITNYYCKKWRPTVLIKSNLLFKLCFIWFFWMYWYFYFIQMNTNFLAKQITAIFNIQAQASSLWGLLKSQCQSANGAVGWWTHYKKPLKQKVSTISSNNITPRIRVYVYMTPTATAPSQKIKRLEECIPFSRWLIYTSFTDFTNNQVHILHMHYISLHIWHLCNKQYIAHSQFKS